MKKLKAISLFSGCGGDTLGMENSGIEVVGYVEFMKDMRASHEQNFPNSVLIGEKYNGNITKIPDSEFLKYKGKIDIIFAGFPCQGFSHGGKKDPNDPRNKLFWEFLRVAKLINPTWVIGENVKGLLTRNNTNGLKNNGEIINKAFTNIGYKMIKPHVVKTEEYGVPQLRRRVFFIGNNKNKKFLFPEPKIQNKNLNLLNILENSLVNAIKVKKQDLPWINFNKINILINDRNEKPSGTPHPYLLLKLKDKEISYGKRIKPTFAEIVDIYNPAKTVQCAFSFQPRFFNLIKKNKIYYIRTLNVLELKKIQGFPADFILKGTTNSQIIQIGNAVPPKIVTIICSEIINKYYAH